MTTQTVKADDAGISALQPLVQAGGAALLEGDTPLEMDGKATPVELGAVIWTYFHPLLPAKTLGK